MKRPYVTLKLATSLDGKIALANGQSEWITGEAARNAGRQFRATHDAIAVGANTAVLDNPQLTTRMAGRADPVRVIFDSRLRLSLSSNLVQTTRDVPVWIFCEDDQSEKAAQLASKDVTLLKVPANPNLDIAVSLNILKQRGIETLLLEGGGTLAASFLKLDCVDVIEWFRAPLILGGDSRNGIGDLGLESLDMARTFQRVAIRELGNDIHERYERR